MKNVHLHGSLIKKISVICKYGSFENFNEQKN